MRSYHLRQWQAFLRYEDLPGSAPTTLYLSGLGMPAHATFASVLAERPLLSNRRPVFVDLLGCGFSDAPEDFAYALQDHADTVILLIDHLGVAGCSVVGYSMGDPQYSHVHRTIGLHPAGPAIPPTLPFATDL